MWSDPALARSLQEGKVAVMPTDTIYGIVGRADNASTVERIYEIRKRAPDKPCIILIASIGELRKFSITPNKKQIYKLKEYWLALPERPTSIVLDCPDAKFAYLYRGTKTLAFRLPAPAGLRKLLRKTGPLIAPSANPEGLPPAKNIEGAKGYFGSTVDLYVDGGEINGKPSQIIRLYSNGSVDTLRA